MRCARICSPLLAISLLTGPARADWDRDRQYLAELVASGKKLAYEHEGKKLKLVIERIEDGALVPAKNKAGLERLVIEEIAPEVLAQQMSKNSYGQYLYDILKEHQVT